MARNGLIDGWRGLSVALVIVGHLGGFAFHESFQARPFRVVFADDHRNWLEIAQQIALRFIEPLPGAGVNVFFIISGFLISSLLMKEYNEHRVINIAAFYVRRSCRIMPAFLAYVASIYALTKLGFVSVPAQSFVWTVSFLCDLPQATCTWWLGHTWSLSVEEQYYLAWPALFIVLGKWRVYAMALTFGVLLGMSFLFPLALSFAYIAIGGLYTLSTRTRTILDRLGTKGMIAIFTATLLLQPLFASLDVVRKMIEAVEPAMLATIFFGTLNGRGLFVPFVSSDWLRRFGLMSYSVYLWQQLFTGAPQFYNNHLLLRNPVSFVVLALLSYYVFEKPFIVVGHHLSNKMKCRGANGEFVGKNAA